jgi:hypothetical protein
MKSSRCKIEYGYDLFEPSAKDDVDNFISVLYILRVDNHKRHREVRHAL